MPNPPRDRSRARELAAEFNQKNDPTGWFDALYRESLTGSTTIPWADLAPNPHLVDFWRAHPQTPASANSQALVIGCGLGDDAEQLSKWGFRTTAFDVSETAVRLAQERFAESPVNFVKANLLDPPPEWRAKFAFVFEAYTLQALPEQVRPRAATNVAKFVAPAGHLLVVARARDAAEPSGEMPWPLTRQEFFAFTQAGLHELSFEDFVDDRETPPTRRFRAFYQRS
ncbi:MAG TPA: class I SAM-dependent methyltransferase [Candidatus Acidoferrales bacterium]